MIKRSPSRNTRSKGIRVKHILQICLLLGVCFWLIYQVKHSHDKKKELDEKDGNISLKAQSGDELLKLGRKDLHPGLQDKTRSENHVEEEEEDSGVEDELNKEENRHQKEQEEEQGRGGTEHEESEREGHMHEEEEREGEGEETNHVEVEKEIEQEEEPKSEETEDEGRGGGDHELDERDQDKIEGEPEHDEEFMDEDKGREDEGGEKESEGHEVEDREVQTNNENQSEDQDHDGDGKSSHEAREEHYKADDASSAVTHDTQIISTEPEKESLEKSNENLAANDLELEQNPDKGNTVDVNGDQNNSTSQVEQGMAENDHSENTTADEKKNDGLHLANSRDESPNNTTVTAMSNDEVVRDNKSTEVSSGADNNQAGANLEVSGSSQETERVNTSDSSQVQNAAIDGQGTGTVTALSNDGSVPGNKSTEVSSEADNNKAGATLEVSGSSQEIEKVNVSVSSQVQNAGSDGQGTGDSSNLQMSQSEQVNNGTISESSQSDSNSTISGKTENVDSFSNDLNSSSNSKSDVSDKIIKPEVTAAEDIGSGLPSKTNRTTEAAHNEKSDTNNASDGTNENSGSSTSNDAGDDPNDSSNSANIVQEEREARIDLGTLPETGMGVINGGNAAEE